MYIMLDPPAYLSIQYCTGEKHTQKPRWPLEFNLLVVFVILVLIGAPRSDSDNFDRLVRVLFPVRVHVECAHRTRVGALVRRVLAAPAAAPLLPRVLGGGALVEPSRLFVSRARLPTRVRHNVRMLGDGDPVCCSIEFAYECKIWCG